MVKKAADGDVEAFGELYRKHRPYIATVIASRISGLDDQLDIEQETFTRAWTKLSELRNPEAFRAWVAQIARRLTADTHRARSRVVIRDFNDPETGPEPIDDDWTPDDWAALRMLSARLDVGLAGLTSRDATVLTMAANLGFGPTEIAAALGIDAGHARVVLHRARRRLAAAVIETIDSDPEPEMPELGVIA